MVPSSWDLPRAPIERRPARERLAGELCERREVQDLDAASTDAEHPLVLAGTKDLVGGWASGAGHVRDVFLVNGIVTTSFPGVSYSRVDRPPVSTPATRRQVQRFTELRR